MTYIATDQAGIAHIVTRKRDGFWSSLCGHGTGAPEYETESEPRRVGRMLTLTDRGCMACARRAIPKTKKEAKADA